MSNSNPAFSRSLVFNQNQVATPSVTELDELYGRPAATNADTARMSYEDTIMKTLITFGLLLAGALVGWAFPILAIPGFIVGLVLAIVNIFKKQPSRGLILTYAGF